MNFEVIWWVKKSKNRKIAKNCNIVFGFFWQKYWSQRAENLYGLSLHYCLQMLFYKDFSILKKIENQSSPPRRRRRRRRTTTTTTTLTVPWSGLRRRQKWQAHICSHDYMQQYPRQCNMFNLILHEIARNRINCLNFKLTFSSRAVLYKRGNSDLELYVFRLVDSSFAGVEGAPLISTRSLTPVHPSFRRTTFGVSVIFTQ